MIDSAATNAPHEVDEGIRIGISIGDVGGIGPEVALKAIAAWDAPGVSFTLIGPGAHWAFHANLLRALPGELGAAIDGALERAVILATPDPVKAASPRLGGTNARHGSIAQAAIERGVSLCREGYIDALVTAPISKEGLKANLCPHPGHTELLQELCGAPEVGMLLVGGGLRVALATIHVSLRSVFELLTTELIVSKAALLNRFLTEWFGDPPVIGLCGLNPHAGEGGMFGDEEERILKPAIEQCAALGIRLDGPRPPDTCFHEALEGAYDAVLALYHDQGLIPVKTLAFDSGVNITMGLPIVRTSPDHGTAFGIAGKGIARSTSMTAAIAAAVDLARARRVHRG